MDAPQHGRASVSCWLTWPSPRNTAATRPPGACLGERDSPPLCACGLGAHRRLLQELEARGPGQRQEQYEPAKNTGGSGRRSAPIESTFPFQLPLGAVQGPPSRLPCSCGTVPAHLGSLSWPGTTLMAPSTSCSSPASAGTWACRAGMQRQSARLQAGNLIDTDLGPLGGTCTEVPATW